MYMNNLIFVSDNLHNELYNYKDQIFKVLCEIDGYCVLARGRYIYIGIWTITK